MHENNLTLDNALYTYVFTKTAYEPLSQRHPFAGGVFSASKNTPVALEDIGKRGLLIAGFCVDAHGEIPRDALARNILENTRELSDLLSYQNRLAGRYILLYREDDTLYALGDAISSMAVYYSDLRDQPCIASLARLVAQICGSAPDPQAKQVRREGIPGYPLPGDATDEQNVYCLLPNHCLNVWAGKAFRYFPADSQMHSLTPQQAADIIHPLLTNIARQYTDHFSFVLPLTAGADSRLIMAYFRQASPSSPSVTFERPTMTAATRTDVAVAEQLAATLSIPHSFLPAKPASSAVCDYCKQYLGADFGNRAAGWPEMFREAFPNNSLYGGAIIDQIGKCGFAGKHLPEFCASASYFSALSGFYGTASRARNHAFASEILNNRGEFSAFDLYAWEWYCARWGNQHQAVYSLLGINHLNLFNCREITLQLIRVPRGNRLRREIHWALYAHFDPQLRQIPINPAPLGTRLRRCLAASAVNQYAGLFARYEIKRMRRKRVNP